MEIEFCIFEAFVFDGWSVVVLRLAVEVGYASGNDGNGDAVTGEVGVGGLELVDAGSGQRLRLGRVGCGLLGGGRAGGGCQYREDTGDAAC